MVVDHERKKHLLADKGYDSKKNNELLKERICTSYTQNPRNSKKK